MCSCLPRPNRAIKKVQECVFTASHLVKEWLARERVRFAIHEARLNLPPPPAGREKDGQENHRERKKTRGEGAGKKKDRPAR